MADSVPTAMQASRADDLLNRAVQELADGKYEDAAPKLTQAAELYDEMRNTLGKAMACYNLGVAMLNAGDPDGAFGWFTIATRLFADSHWPAGVSLSEAAADSVSLIKDVE